MCITPRLVGPRGRGRGGVYCDLHTSQGRTAHSIPQFPVPCNTRGSWSTRGVRVSGHSGGRCVGLGVQFLVIRHQEKVWVELETKALVD
ncbi:hypothetical protein RRG08_020064 [Elysia crispata]|uniref:Uncharacterized protein n=1 Tax=Elysia crispata TaxID=231223 RepID=A0AAE0Z2S4_9GAST|nr:hypothetical protein RRG08_020064 [Elysia crispata]